MTTVLSPFTGGEIRIIDVTETHKFRGQDFTVTSQCYECVDTGEQFTDTEQDEAFVQELRRQWLEYNCVPTPAQLTARRKELGLSGVEMASLLGLGINQYRKYEKGDFPSESNVRLLQVAMDERALLTLRDSAIKSLSNRAIERIQQHLNRQLLNYVRWHSTEHPAKTEEAQKEHVRDVVSRTMSNGGISHIPALSSTRQVKHAANEGLVYSYN